MAYQYASVILQGEDDPEVVAQEAPNGYLYIRIGVDGGDLYVKQDDGLTTNWLKLGTGSGQVDADITLFLRKLRVSIDSSITALMDAGFRIQKYSGDVNSIINGYAVVNADGSLEILSNSSLKVTET